MVAAAILELPDNLTIANVLPIHNQFEALVENSTNGRIIIRAAAVARADNAGIQLLHAFVIEAQDKEITLDWESPSEKLCLAADILGMKGLFDVQ